MPQLSQLVTTTLTVALLGYACGTAAAAVRVEGQVQAGGGPLASSTVTLWAASAGEPKQLAQAKSGNDGRFELRTAETPGKDVVLYVIAKGGIATVKKGSGDNPAIALLTVLGNKPPAKVVINELTTVASTFTAARFITGDSISGNPLGLRIAAGNAPNLVDPVTGKWGKVLVDPLNSYMTTTMANLDTLGSLISAYFTVADDAWRVRFLKAATPPSGVAPKNTLEAMAGIARAPWAAPKELYALFDEAYPQPADGARRSAPFVPYLAYVPDDFALSLCFSGGGDYANGRFMFDAEGNLWSGQNWMPGSQSGVNHSIGGGVVKFSPNGKALSPDITGFTGMGIDGVGWGTAVAEDKVWITSFDGSILLLDFDGHPIGKESDFPMAGQMGQLMGVGIAANGDVWIADGSKNQLYFFPGGRVKEGKTVQVPGLKSPFDIVIDDQNRVWVANSQADFVTRFPANDPSKVETFQVGLTVRGLALDSKGNLRVGSGLSRDFKMPQVPDGATIMEQFRIQGEALFSATKTTGVVNLIRADGTQPRETGRQKLNFFGTSSGGIRAAAYAQAQPERIERLILSAFTYKGNGAAEIARRQQRIAELRANPRRKRDAVMIRSIFTRDGHASAYDPAVAEAIIAAEMKFGDTIPSGTYLDMAANLPVVDPTKVMSPVLMTRGEWDGNSTNDDLLDFFRQLPNGDRQFVILPQTPHAADFSNNRHLLWYAMKNYLAEPTAAAAG